jgi:hypothetical protein
VGNEFEIFKSNLRSGDFSLPSFLCMVGKESGVQIKRNYQNYLFIPI